MATKKKSKKKVSHVRSFAAVEAQFVALEEQIALLQEQNALLQAQSAGRKVSPKLTPSGSRLSPKVGVSFGETDLPENRLPEVPTHRVVYPLAPPSIENVTAIGSRFIRVSWIPVPNASGYVVRYSPDSAFVNNVHAVTVNATDAAITLSGLEPDTTYYVGIMATGEGSYLDSPFSVAKSVKTGIASGGETATQLQSWLAGQQSMFQDFATLLPQLDSTVLSLTERRRLNGSGVRRYGFIDKVSDVSADWPQFWPAAVSGVGGSVDFQDRLKERLREIEVLRNLLVWSNYVARVVRDLLLIASDDAFRMSNVYYTTVRSAARNNLPEARQVFQMIESFWQRPRRMSQEPTIPEVERDIRALLRGTKEGSVYVENESDTVVKGKKTVIDKTRRKPRNGFKEIETGEVDLSADSADVC